MSDREHEAPTEPFGRRVVRGIAFLVAGAVVIGLLLDVFSGLAIFRGARSRPAWAVGTLVLGALYVTGEVAARWINARDRTTDPLRKRLPRLLALLVLAGALILGMIAVIRGVS
jgi:hypothetical protein